MRLLSGGKLFCFGQQILLAENVVKGPAQYKFGLACWYHLFLVTKNIIKVNEEDICDFVCFLQIYFCLSSDYFLFGLAGWYHLLLVTKNIIKVYKEDVCDFIRFLQIYLCLLCVYFFFDNLWKDSVVFSFCPKIYFTQNV